VRKQNANPKRVYAVDPALARRVSFKFTEDIVFIELKRRKCEVYYHKQKRECDFLVKEGLQITRAIQVCWAIDEDNRKKRN
jgi:uncharacterized protein